MKTIKECLFEERDIKCHIWGWGFDTSLVKINKAPFFLGPNIMFYQYLGAKYYALHDKKYLRLQEYYESLLKSDKLR